MNISKFAERTLVVRESNEERGVCTKLYEIEIDRQLKTPAVWRVACGGAPPHIEHVMSTQPLRVRVEPH